MDFLSNLAKGGHKKPDSDQPSNPDNSDQKPSTTDLFNNAKVVADAAQSQFRNDPEGYDKKKAAGAAADLLDAAQTYGKLDENQGIGKYVDQAEGYLRKYDTPQSKTDTTDPTGEYDSEKTKHTTDPTGEYDSEKTKHTTDGENTLGGAGEYAKKGDGDYDKKGEDFSDKPSYGGAGDYGRKEEEYSSKPSEYGGDRTDASSEYSSKPSEYGGGRTDASSEYSNKPSEYGGGRTDASSEYSNKPSEYGGDRTDGSSDYSNRPSEYGGERTEGGFTRKSE